MEPVAEEVALTQMIVVLEDLAEAMVHRDV
jgi:hypothetical protein